MSLTAYEVDALRKARFIHVWQFGNEAEIGTTLGVPRNLAQLVTAVIPFVPTYRSMKSVTIQPDVRLGASREWGGDADAHELILRRPDLHPEWPTFAAGLQEGDDIRVQWEREDEALLLVHLRNGRTVQRLALDQRRRFRRLRRGREREAATATPTR